MQKVKVRGTINAPAKDVWELVSDFNALDQFVEAVADCSTEGIGVGAVRTLTLEDGAKVKEKLESMDTNNRVMTYSILESPMPIENYTGTMEVNQKDKGESEFIWSSTFDAAESTEDDMEQAFKDLYNLGITGLQDTF